MGKISKNYPEVHFLTTPKWAIPLALFVAVSMVAYSVYSAKNDWAFGTLFGFGSAEAQSSTKVCGMNVDPANPSGNPAGDQFASGTWVRLVFKEENYADYDPIIDSYNSAGLNVLMILNHETYWGCAPWDNPGCADQYATEYAALATRVASHYAGKVNAYEVWNEPDLSGSYIPPDVMGKIANAVSPAIRATDPSAYIILGGFGGGASEILGYINAMSLTAGFDGVGGHPYGQGVNGVGESYGTIEDYVSTLSRSGLPIWITEFGLQCSSDCSTSASYMENFYNYADGESRVPVAIWFGWSDGMKDGFGITDSGGGEKGNYSTFFTEGCDSNVIPAKPGLTPVGEGTWGGPGSGSRPRCISDIQTPLVPIEQKYSGQGEIQLSNGSGGAYALMNVNDVSVTAFLQNLDVESNSDVVNMSAAAAVEKDFSYNVNYNLVSGYPADGMYYHKAMPRVESWLDEVCMADNSHNQDANRFGIDEDHWPFQATSAYPMDQCGSGSDFGSRTMYADHLFHSTISKRDYVYFPLGTALGSVAGEDPYNIYANWDMAEDFQDDEAKLFEGAFSDQNASLDYVSNFLQSKFVQFWLGLLGLLDSDINRGIHESVPGGLTMNGVYTDAKSSGEKGVEIGDFDYNSSCDALESLLGRYNNEVLPAYKDYISDACRLRLINPDCLTGALPLTDPACKPGLVDKTKCEGVREAESNAKGAMGTISDLLERCRGNGTTKIKIAGVQQDSLAELELTAPFVPIMAQYRIWDVINSQGTVCDEASENLIGGEVSVDLTWYDKNGLPTGQAYNTCDHTGSGIGPQNLLTNGSFESAWGGSPGGTASGSGAPGWNFVWKKNYTPGVDADYQSDSCGEGGGQNLEYCNAPEFQPSDAGSDQRRVLDGDLSSKWFTFANKHDVLAYQVVGKVPAGYDLFGYFQGWRNTDNGEDDFRSDDGCVQTDSGYVGDSEAEICLYYGDITSIIGGEHEIPLDQYDSLMDTIRSNGTCSSISNDAFYNEWQSGGVTSTQSGKVTVVIRSSAEVAANNTDDYWDNICLIPSGTAISESVVIPSAPSRSSSSDECRLYEVPQQSCELQVGSSKSASKVIFKKDMTFYMPGLGAMPFIAERVETGSAKSMDGNISSPMCKDRSDSDVKHSYNKVYAALDIYIIQNLSSDYAHRFAKFIAPNDYSIEEVNQIRNDASIELNTGDLGESASRDLDRAPTENESLIIQAAKEDGFTKEQTAYVLASAMIETGVRPIAEYGCSCPGGCTTLDNGNTRSYGNPDLVTGKCYYGRGFIQLTHKSNYESLSTVLGFDLVANPSLALDSEIASQIIIKYFEVRNIRDVIPSVKPGEKIPGLHEIYVDARSMVNGDKETIGETVAIIAEGYLDSPILENY